MSKIADYAKSTAEHLKEWFHPFDDKMVVNYGFLPTKSITTGHIHVDVMPSAYHGETVQQRRLCIRHEDNAILILVRSKMPEKYTDEDFDAVAGMVEPITNLMLDTAYGDDAHVSSVDVNYEFAKGIFSASIIVHIKAQYGG